MAMMLKTIDKIPFAPVVAIAFGLVSAALVFAVPDWRFSQAVTASGLPEILSAARPPLGDTARALVALAMGFGVGIFLWIGLSAMGALVKARKPKRMKARGTRIEPIIATKSATKTAMPQHRRPIFAERDLGAPFMSDEVVANAPNIPDAEELVLETPMLDETPEFVATPVMAPLPVIEPAKAVAPAPVFAVQPVERVAPTNEQSVGDLMLRLESAVARRTNRGAPAGDIASLRQALRGI